MVTTRLDHFVCLGFESSTDNVTLSTWPKPAVVSCLRLRLPFPEQATFHRGGGHMYRSRLGGSTGLSGRGCIEHFDAAHVATFNFLGADCAIGGFQGHMVDLRYGIGTPPEQCRRIARLTGHIE